VENVRAMIDDRAQTIRDVTLPSVELHPAKRWGALVGLALSCASDLTTVAAWAREAGMCETQLRLRCRLAGVTAKVSLDFVRVLRAARWREARGGALADYLDVGDPRTMRRLLARVGLSGPDATTVLEYVSAQRVIRNVALIEELAKVLTPMTMVHHHDGSHH
jgi:hypothetical protein